MLSLVIQILVYPIQKGHLVPDSHSAQIFTDRSVSIDPDAIILRCGWVLCLISDNAVDRKQKAYGDSDYDVYHIRSDKFFSDCSRNIPVWPSSVCTISRVCRSHKYTLLSSLPETIHLPPVTLKQAAIQYFAF